MYMPHTVTLYNVGAEDIVTLEQPISITVLRGVFLDETLAANVRQSGLESADAVELYIPFNVAARDGVTGEAKSFLRAKEYENAADASDAWTLTVGGSANVCFFVKGEVVVTGRDFQYINANYDDVYRVTKVDTKDYGTPDMRHWEVGGR